MNLGGEVGGTNIIHELIELPLATVDDEFATFARDSDVILFGGEPIYKMPRRQWIEKGRPLEITIGVGVVPDNIIKHEEKK